jgi:hypothetical protein
MQREKRLRAIAQGVLCLFLALPLATNAAPSLRSAIAASGTRPAAVHDDALAARRATPTRTPSGTATHTPVPATMTATASPPTATPTNSPTTVLPSQTPTATATPTGGPPPSIVGLHVSGNQLLDASNQPVVLHGVDRSGTEYACVQGWGIFDGPSDAASVRAIASWHANAVRVPLNEDCWLGVNGVNPAYAGANYRTAIVNYVNLLNQNGLAAILDLHWTAPGSNQATGQQPMPDQDHSPAFWQSVAATFKGNLSVIFDLFNEPYPDNNQDTTAAWTCWRDGGTCAGVGFQAAGMQSLVNAVRDTGATNVIMLGGVEYANSLSQWLAYEPTDSAHNLTASWHSYNFNICTTSSCWQSQVAPVAAVAPLITGELGENDCGQSYINPLMSWLDSHGASYLAWTWDTWSGATCSPGTITLIADYTGTPIQQMGQAYHDHLACLASGSCKPSSSYTPPVS